MSDVFEALVIEALLVGCPQEIDDRGFGVQFDGCEDHVIEHLGENVAGGGCGAKIGGISPQSK